MYGKMIEKHNGVEIFEYPIPATMAGGQQVTSYYGACIGDPDYDNPELTSYFIDSLYRDIDDELLELGMIDEEQHIDYPDREDEDL